MTPQRKLFNYGIREERSDVRVHVSPVTQRLYVFPTADVQKLLNERGEEFREVPAYQDGIDYATATGLLVPWNQIPNIRVVRVPKEWWADGYFQAHHTTTTKGQRAVQLVTRGLEEGYIPLPFNGKGAFNGITEPTNVVVQRDGSDVIVCGRLRIQVKCDWLAGPKELNGSGHIFLQLTELNPRKRY
jgi:hypothetical protein